ncbi:hypothetical protein [Sphingobacterium sp. 18053]|uniref:hypothetical protein n=1 Tax=Sphingobacterium sp. 18053 TaxID=2681401 RepID=UPI001357D94E|nr:hypothetical protein [Sphingobacterium sp. 18053]
MLFAVNNQNEDLGFIKYFIANAKMDSSYLEYVKSILKDSKDLASGNKQLFETDPESRRLKILISRIAKPWLQELNLENVSNQDLDKLEQILAHKEQEKFALSF